MDIKEVRANLGRKVRYKNEHAGIDGEYFLTAFTIRSYQNRIFCQAELQQGNNSVIIAPLASVEVIPED